MTLFELIRAAIKEDMPRGDLTSECLGLPPRHGTARLIAKQDLILSGATAFEQSIQFLEPNVRIKWHFEEGQKILQKQNICTLQGDLIQILKAERVALNFLMHLSGIASYTAQFVDQVKNTKTKILDTRKTLPGYRELEKKAVLHGGGQSHRLNLSTSILIKDNHIALAGGVRQAIERIRRHTHLPLDVEACSLDEVQQAVDCNVEHILLDNMDNDTLTKALRLIPSHIRTEASGNMTLERVQSVANLGVDYISVGALTHSAPSADISLKFDW